VHCRASAKQRVGQLAVWRIRDWGPAAAKDVARRARTSCTPPAARRRAHHHTWELQLELVGARGAAAAALSPRCAPGPSGACERACVWACARTEAHGARWAWAWAAGPAHTASGGANPAAALLCVTKALAGRGGGLKPRPIPTLPCPLRTAHVIPLFRTRVRATARACWSRSRTSTLGVPPRSRAWVAVHVRVDDIVGWH